MTGGYVLYGGPGTGAVAVEAALRIAGEPYELLDVYDNPDALERYTAINPMRQAPALTFPDGETLTESAAILLRVAELHPASRLAPEIDAPTRGAFLRWMSFVSSAIYAHYWLKDDPSRLVPDKDLHQVVNERLEQRLLTCWGIMEKGVAVLGARPYILGQDLTVLDLYVTVVSRFRPRRQRFYAAAPRLGESVRLVDADPRLASLWAERYPFAGVWDR
ncbi:MAG TPA: glutathione S-transferase family protein [Phenylobacterium sp.]